MTRVITKRTASRGLTDMSGVLCGIDVGGTSAKIALFDEAGNMLRKWELPTGKAAAGKETLSVIADSVRKALEAMERDISSLDGVGLTVPGPVLPDGSVREFANLSWGNIPFREILSEELQGTPVEVINDANAAALGELWKGAGEGLFSLVMVTLGTGVGGGIVVNGKIVTTEAKAKDAGIETVTGKFIMTANGKSLITKDERGFIKVVSNAETDEILGAQMMCSRATDMIGEFVTAIANHMTVADMLRSVRSHPTYNEGIGEALESVHGESLHTVPRRRR